MDVHREGIWANGPLEGLWQPEEIHLRQITYSGVKVLQGVYFAVRDPNWKTVPQKQGRTMVTEREGGWRVEQSFKWESEEILFEGELTITSESPERLKFVFRGAALSEFGSNRIGFLILHGAECAGEEILVEATDGTVIRGRFPGRISPHQPFTKIKAFTHFPADGLELTVRMEGAVFEMEDQRNWTDASFKTYSTPLSEPFPRLIRKGDFIEQSIDVTISKAAKFVPSAKGAAIDIEPVQGIDRTEWPALGTEYHPNSEVMGSGDIEVLRSLGLAYLRVEIQPEEPSMPEILEKAIHLARVSGLGLELVVFMDSDQGEAVGTLLDVAVSSGLQISRIIVCPVTTKVCEEGHLHQLRAWRADRNLKTPLIAGTDGFFTEVNRERPPIDIADGVSFSLNPTVHASDSLSLLETLPIQSYCVRDAFGMGAKSVCVSPLTFRMRRNPNATTPEGYHIPEAMQVDERQWTDWGAAWIFGSLKYLAESGVSAVTLLKVTGPVGIFPPGKPAFTSPQVRLLRELEAFRGAHITPCASSQPMKAVALFLEKNWKRTILATNFTEEPQSVSFSWGKWQLTAELDPLKLTSLNVQ